MEDNLENKYIIARESDEERPQDNNLQPNIPSKDFLSFLLSKAEKSIPYNITKVTLPFAALVTTTIVLSLSEPACAESLNYFFFLMVINDLLAVILRSLVLYNLVEPTMQRKRDSTVPDLLIPDEDLRQNNFIYGSSSLVLISSKKLKRRRKLKKTVMVVWWLKAIYYVALIIYGQIVFANHCGSDVRCILALVYLIMGYLYIGVPALVLLVAIIFLGKKCWNPFKCLKGLCKKKKMSDSELNQFTVERFNIDLPGFHECGICNKQYEKREFILRLTCDETHHFHEKCIRKELQKTNCCPICGFNFKESGTNRDEEE